MPEIYAYVTNLLKVAKIPKFLRGLDKADFYMNFAWLQIDRNRTSALLQQVKSSLV